MCEDNTEVAKPRGSLSSKENDHRRSIIDREALALESSSSNLVKVSLSFVDCLRNQLRYIDFILITWHLLYNVLFEPMIFFLNFESKIL